MGNKRGHPATPQRKLMLILDEFIKFLGLENTKSNTELKSDIKSKDDSKIIECEFQAPIIKEEIERIDNAGEIIEIKRIVEIIPLGDKKAQKISKTKISKTKIQRT